MSETELIDRCLQKDPLAWNEFVKRYSSLILIAAENHLKKYGFFLSAQEAEDIRQNVLASLWRDNKLQQVKNRKTISWWLAIVAGNEAINYIRTRVKQGIFREKSLFEKINETELIDIIPSDKLRPGQELENTEMLKRVEEAIEALPAKERLILKLSLVHGKKHYEISDMLAMPKGTVCVCVKRGKDRLRKALKEFRV